MRAPGVLHSHAGFQAAAYYAATPSGSFPFNPSPPSPSRPLAGVLAGTWRSSPCIGVSAIAESVGQQQDCYRRRYRRPYYSVMFASSSSSDGPFIGGQQDDEDNDDGANDDGEGEGDVDLPSSQTDDDASAVLSPPQEQDGGTKTPPNDFETFADAAAVAAAAAAAGEDDALPPVPRVDEQLPEDGQSTSPSSPPSKAGDGEAVDWDKAWASTRQKVDLQLL